MPELVDQLVEEARGVRENAYARYSGYKVGAALSDERGRVFLGANAENVAFGSTLCAERAAVLAMVAAGGRRIRALAVATSDGGTPCGACLQVLREFAGTDLPIYLASDSGVEEATLGSFLPRGFDSNEVDRTLDGG